MADRKILKDNLKKQQPTSMKSKSVKEKIKIINLIRKSCGADKICRRYYKFKRRISFRIR